MNDQLFYILDQSSADVLCKYRILELADKSATRAHAFDNSKKNVIVQRKFKFMGMRIWFGLKYFSSIEEGKDFLYQKGLKKIERRQVAVVPTRAKEKGGEHKEVNS
jgi:hypothetical protein